MQGDQKYKQKLGTNSEPIYTVSIFQKSFAGRLNHFIIGGIQKRRAAKAMKAKPTKDQD
jgi:CelD/BcsL family acetyltransferase involved in cellulose biosynthesis